MGKKVKLHWTEVVELAAICCEMGSYYDRRDIEAELAEKFGLGFDEFKRLIEILVPLTPTWRSLLTDTPYQGFVLGNHVILKVEVE